jgi:hypothetical protein
LLALPSAFAQEDAPGTPVEVPFVLYDDDVRGPLMPYDPWGLMGAAGAVDVDPAWDDSPHTGETCMRVEVVMNGMWAGAAWLNPQNDWGDLPGGYNLSDASKLTFWARGEKGGEKVDFKVAILQDDKAYPDSAKEQEKSVRLRAGWKQYKLWLRGDKERVKCGFAWVVGAADQDTVFYLDDIQFE